MEEFRVDMRLTTPEEQAKYMQQGALLHRFNNCMPYSAEKQEAAKALFGDNLGEGSMVQPPLKGVCFDMVHIGKNVMIMPDCLMMSRGGITIEDGAMIAANVQLISNNHDLHDRQILICKPVRRFVRLHQISLQPKPPKLKRKPIWTISPARTNAANSCFARVLSRSR